MLIATEMTLQCGPAWENSPDFVGFTGNDRLGINRTSRGFGTIGADTICILDNDDFDSLDGSKDGLDDTDSLWFGRFVSNSGVTVLGGGDEAGSYIYDSTVANGEFRCI